MATRAKAAGYHGCEGVKFAPKETEGYGTPVALPYAKGAEMFWKVTQSGPAGVLCSHPLGGTLLIIRMSRLLTCAVTVFPLLLGYALFVCKRLTC